MPVWFTADPSPPGGGPAHGSHSTCCTRVNNRVRLQCHPPSETLGAVSLSCWEGEAAKHAGERSHWGLGRADTLHQPATG